jgi:hypothetical protein
MEHLSEEQRQRIVESAERCERALGFESTYVRAGHFASAALCAEAAELDSFMAFSAAGGRTWMVGA